MAFTDAKDVPYEEKMLWAAVLRRAAFDYVLYKGVRAHSLEWKRTVAYIFTEGLRYEHGVSFEEVCDLFGWDPDHLRRMITRLTRDDIKKMETTQFKDDFVYDMVRIAVAHTDHWKTANFATPFLPNFQYNEEYREKFKPRVIKRESFLKNHSPIVVFKSVG